MSDYFNLEYEVMKWATDKLCTGIRHAHKSLCRVLFSKDLLTMQVQLMCSDNTVDRDTFVQTMVTTLQDRVRNDPNAYYTIVAILKAESGLSYLGCILEEQMIAEQEKKTERNEVEKKQSILGIMEAEKKHQKLVEDERHNAKLHYQDTAYLVGCLPGNKIHRPEDLSFSKVEATNYPPGTAEARNATPIAPAGAMQSSHTIPQMVSFGGQKHVSCTEGGDALLLAGTGPEYILDNRTDVSPFMMMPIQSQFSKMGCIENKLRELNIAMGMEYKPTKFGMHSANVPYEDMVTPTNPSTKIGGNEIPKSSTIDNNVSPEYINKPEMRTHMDREMEDHEEEQNEDEEGEMSQRDMHDRQRNCSESSSTNKISKTQEQPSSYISDDDSESEVYETPLGSAGSSLDFYASPVGNTCNNCQFLIRKVDELEEDVKEKLKLIQSQEKTSQTNTKHFSEQIELYRRQLNEKEQQKFGLHMHYEEGHQEMVNRTNHLMLRLQTLTEYIVRGLISEHQREIEIQKTKKEKDRAVMEKEWAERERDEAEKERDMEKSKRLEKEILRVTQELQRPKLLQCKELCECQWDDSTSTPHQNYPHPPETPSNHTPHQHCPIPPPSVPSTPHLSHHNYLYSPCTATAITPSS